VVSFFAGEAPPRIINWDCDLVSQFQFACASEAIGELAHQWQASAYSPQAKF